MRKNHLFAVAAAAFVLSACRTGGNNAAVKDETGAPEAAASAPEAATAPADSEALQNFKKRTNPLQNIEAMLHDNDGDIRQIFLTFNTDSYTINGKPQNGRPHGCELSIIADRNKDGGIGWNFEVQAYTSHGDHAEVGGPARPFWFTLGADQMLLQASPGWNTPNTRMIIGSPIPGMNTDKPNPATDSGSYDESQKIFRLVDAPPAKPKKAVTLTMALDANQSPGNVTLTYTSNFSAPTTIACDFTAGSATVRGSVTGRKFNWDQSFAIP